ncbi:MAG: crotonase/enoyl-CoA hydratase family protein [Proteobacteria bacterium]|nr:crotonase/enoyl-CoA hydratase family protein [Pseudomonadota bacterium]
MNHLQITKENHITIIAINRPEVRNAVNRDTATQLVEAFREFDADNEQDIAILTGSGGTFCSGADLKSIAEGKGNRVETSGDGPMGPTRMILSKPVLAAVEGYAVAGGLELAIWCDLRIVARDAAFGVFCRRWGVPLIDGGTIRLSRLIGHSRALDLILTGREVSADEAERIGLANRISEPGQALSAAKKLAEQLMTFPQQCMRSDRLSSYKQWDLTLEDALKKETEMGLKVIHSGETAGGAKQFTGGKGRHGAFD